MPIGISRAAHVKFEKPGDRHGGEIVDFRVVQKADYDTNRPLYFQRNEDGASKTFSPYAPDGRPNDPIVQWEVTVDTGIEDSEGDTERRIFIDPRKGKRGTALEGKRAGDAISSALKKAKAHRVGLEIGGSLYLIFDGKVRDGRGPENNTWSAEYAPPAGGPGTGSPVDEMPWLIGGSRYDRAAEVAKWEVSKNSGLANPYRLAETAARPSPPAEDDGLAERQAEARSRLDRAHSSNPKINRNGEEPPF
jgi:hypothetical protein